MGNKNDAIVFIEEQWQALLQYQSMITNYLYANALAEPISADLSYIFFKEISSTKGVRIWKNNLPIYQWYETVCMIWELLSVLINIEWKCPTHFSGYI